jgi:Fe-S oxidoreductase
MSRLDLLLLAEESLSFADDEYLRQRLKTVKVWPRFEADERAAAEAELGLEDDDLWVPMRSGGHLLRPPHRPSLALCDLATAARDAGYEVAIVDNVARYSHRRGIIERLVAEQRPRLIGLTTTFLLSEREVRDTVALIRLLAPGAKIVLGGPTVRRRVALHGLADYAVFGSGEQAIVGLLGALDGNADPARISGLAIRNPDGSVTYGESSRELARVGRTGEAYRTRDDEAIPIPDWSLYPRSRDTVYAIEFSRGCKYNCFYCAYDRGKVVRPLAEIRAELLANSELGITRYRVGDSNFTDGPPRHRDYPLEVCKLMIELDLGLEWSCYSRVDDLTDELADHMRRAGCWGCFFGVESGDDRILKLMRKGHDLADAHQGLAVARRHGLFAHVNMIAGYPGETDETFRNTLDFVLRARPDSFALGQFYLVDKAPVRGRAMDDFGLEGEGLRWRHRTMDSDRAAALVAAGIDELLAAGLELSNEMRIVEYMGWGMSLDQARLASDALSRCMRGAERKIADEARRQLKALFCGVVPRWLARDLRAVDGR